MLYENIIRITWVAISKRKMNERPYLCTKEQLALRKKTIWVHYLHIRGITGAESSCCCFPKELVSFDPRHVTRFPPIGNLFKLGDTTTKTDYCLA